jgi:hypothetical protein
MHVQQISSDTSGMHTNTHTHVLVFVSDNAVHMLLPNRHAVSSHHVPSAHHAAAHHAAAHHHSTSHDGTALQECDRRCNQQYSSIAA